MISFPNAKINLGLHVLERRNDGFHSIESIIVPIPLCDSLEIVPDSSLNAGECELEIFGASVPGDPSENLVCQVYNLLDEDHDLPGVRMALLKNIPMGAGLGGGSADAAFAMRMLNDLFKLNLTSDKMQSLCALLGSDCPFFIRNEVAFASGRGEILSPVNLDLGGMSIVVVTPSFGISTREAYAGITPDPDKEGELITAVASPMSAWKESIANDFETVAFKSHAKLVEVKNNLYEQGAVYASMTGSGSSFYGLFKRSSPMPKIEGYQFWTFPTG